MNKKIMNIALIILWLGIVLSVYVMATPSGPNFDYASTSTSTSANGTGRTDARGTITTLVLNTSQINTKWKAYVGNVTGRLLLQDANNYTIYEWSLGAFTGEVYASRNSSISWSNIGCANSTTIATEDTSLNLQSNTQNSINGTFNETTHKTFNVGGVAIPQSLCRATYTYNTTGAQIPATSARFQEILLQDNSSKKMVYSTPLEINHPGYNGNPFDFQMLVADDDSQVTAQTYYFFVELN
jgi:hypothetical protein